MTPNLLHDIEAIAAKVRDGFVAVFHAIEHEVPAILSLLVNVYGPEVVAHAIASHATGVQLYAASEVGVAEADTKAFVQSNLVDRFHLPPTAAQFIASGIHHLFTIGGEKIAALIDQGTTSAEQAADPGFVPPSVPVADPIPATTATPAPATTTAIPISDQQKASGFTGVSGS